MKRRGPQADQNGMVVVIALLMMAVLSLLAVGMMGLSVTESQIGSNEADLKKALFAAEAGIQEAMYRLRLPTTLVNEGTACTSTADPVVIGFAPGGVLTIPNPDPANANFWKYNPPTCAWAYSGTSATGWGNYFGGNAANLNSAGRTFIFDPNSLTAAHLSSPPGPLANANLTNGGSYAVTVAPVVGFVGGCWQYVDPFGAPLSSCPIVATNPVFKVTSTGAARDGRKVLSTMIRRFNVAPEPDGVLTANSDVKVTSASAVIDGHNYDCNGNNPSPTDGKPAVAAPPKPPPNESEPEIDFNNEGNLVCEAGTGDACGTVRTPFPSTIGALLLGPGATTTEIDAFNAYLESIKVATGPPENDPPFHGIVYVNGNYTQPPDGSTGILIVHNAANTANLGNWNGGTFKGVVIADSINKINGNVTIIGSVFGWGSASTVQVDITAGTPQLKYSKCVLDGLPQIFPFQIVKGTWHEKIQ